MLAPRTHVGAAGSPSRRSRRARRSVGLPAIAVLALTLTACGSHRSHSDFVQAAGGVATTVTDSGTTGGDVTGSTGGAVTSPTAAAGTTGSQPAGTTGIHQVVGGGGTSGSTTGAGTSGAVGSTGGSRDRCATSGSTITLGNISTQSGVLGELFKGLPEALQVWAKAANACGGLGGHPVKVISADDGGDPSTALTLAQRMVEQDHVLAFVGLEQPLSVEGEADYLKKVGVPSIGGDSSEMPFFTNPMFFPIGPFVSVIGLADADIAIKAGKKKIAVFYCAEIPNSCGSSAASKFLQNGSAEVAKMGGQVVLYQSASITAASYTSQCLSARNAGADAIIDILDGPSIGRMAGDCSSQGYNPKFLGISLGLSGNLTDYPALKNNFSAPLNTFPWNDSSVPATAAYQAAFKKYYGRVISGPSPAMGWASGVLAQEATKGGLPANPTSADIVKGLLQIRNNNLGGLTAPLTFTSALPRTGITSCYFQVSISGGQFSPNAHDQCLPLAIKDPR